jgi:hypothetical protein
MPITYATCGLGRVDVKTKQHRRDDICILSGVSDTTDLDDVYGVAHHSIESAGHVLRRG